MNATYIRIDLASRFKDAKAMMFTLAMPVLMYGLFGLNATDVVVGPGINLRFFVMSSMGAYAAAMAATSVTGMAATESMLGWGRQISLTRQPAFGFVLNKVAVAFIVACLGVSLVFYVGYSTGAQAPAAVWWQTWLITLVGAVLFGAYGLAIGLHFQSESAISMATAGLVFLSFLGNLFTPLSGTMLTVARFTPMYGYAGLLRWPALGGQLAQVNPPQTDSIWLLLANFAGWLTVFAALSITGVKKARQRQ